MPSFDIVSEVNMQEVDNAINQARKEISTRYDFRGSKAEIGFENNEIKLVGDDDYKMKALKDILHSKLTKRGVDLKALDYQKEEDAALGLKRQAVKLISGLSKEKAKEIVKFIKEEKSKVQPAINGDLVRVTSKSIDELQNVISRMKSADLGVPLQFTNMRS